MMIAKNRNIWVFLTICLFLIFGLGACGDSGDDCCNEDPGLETLTDPEGFYELTYDSEWVIAEENAADIKADDPEIITNSVLAIGTGPTMQAIIGIIVYSADEYKNSVAEYNIEAITQFEKQIYEADEEWEILSAPETFENSYGQVGYVFSTKSKTWNWRTVCYQIATTFLFMDTEGRVYVFQYAGCYELNSESKHIDMIENFHILNEVTLATVTPSAAETGQETGTE